MKRKQMKRISGSCIWGVHLMHFLAKVSSVQKKRLMLKLKNTFILYCAKWLWRNKTNPSLPIWHATDWSCLWTVLNTIFWISLIWKLNCKDYTVIFLQKLVKQEQPSTQQIFSLSTRQLLTAEEEELGILKSWASLNHPSIRSTMEVLLYGLLLDHKI